MPLPQPSPSAPVGAPLPSFRAGLTALLLIGGAACKGDDPVPTTAVAVTSNSIAAPVATRLREASAPAVTITDAKGRGMRNLLVKWTVTGGGGTVVNDTSRTNVQGEASSGGWNLGTTAGVQTLQASVDGVKPVIFTAATVPGAVAELTPVTTAFTSVVVNQEVAPLVSVRAKDAYGNFVPATTVVFSLVQPQGAVVGETQVTDAQGLATLPRWQLGTTANTQSIRALAGSAPPLTISVVAKPGPLARLIAVNGPEFSSVASEVSGITPTVRTADAFNNGIANVPVTWAPGANSGSVSSSISVSDDAGAASPGSWLLGSAATQTMTASSSAIPGATVTFTARTIRSTFDIDVRFVGGGGTELVRQAFRTAALRWRTLITADIHSDRVRLSTGQCASWQPALDTLVNDVIIFARVAAIDGVGSILGRAGPCVFNSDNLLPYAGIMEFDEADMPNLIANGGLVDVITHEMGHVLGIGTFWNLTSGGSGKSRALLVNAGGADPFFQGAAARAGFAAVNTVLYSGNPVPVENSGGGGTRDSHWRESTFARELMTGFYNSGALNPLSRITVGSLQDLGYTVNFAAAEPYSVTALLYAFPFAPSATAIPFGDDVMHLPLYEQRDGRTTLIRPAR
jgi:hypothetical protein